MNRAASTNPTVSAPMAHQSGGGCCHSKTATTATLAAICVLKLCSPRNAIARPANANVRRRRKGWFFIADSLESLAAVDLEDPKANYGGSVLEAVTKDQLNVGLKGQIRYRVSERHLYAYLFGVKNPVVHVMAYFVSILRERIANFEAPPLTGEALASQPSDASAVSGVSINDLRKNLRDLNEHMDRECLSSPARGTPVAGNRCCAS